MKTKKCSKCGEVKTLDCFSKNSTKKDGLQIQCKTCNSVYGQINKETIAATRKAHHKANKERLNAISRAYREENREILISHIRSAGNMKLDSADWDILLPGTIVKIGNQNLNVKPLGLSDLALLMRELKAVIVRCEDAGISLDNYQSKFVELAGIILSEAPQVLTLLTGLDIDDVKRLPLAIAVELLIACFKANIDSQEDLAKNLVALTNQIGALVNAGEAKAADSVA